MEVTTEFVEGIRKKWMGRNEYFRRPRRLLQVVSDDPLGCSPEVSRYLQKLGYHIASSHIIDSEAIAIAHEYICDRAEEIFEKTYARISKPLNLTTLAHTASIENKNLVTRIETSGTKTVLLEEFMDTLFDPNNLSTNALVHYLNSVDKKNPAEVTPSRITILTQTNLVAPLAVSDEGEVRYHPLGRKGKLYGANGYLFGGRQHLVAINATPFSQDANFDIDTYVREILNHEVIGHAMLGLNDHNNMKPNKCVMATKKSDGEYRAIVREKKGLYVCGECEKALPE